MTLKNITLQTLKIDMKQFIKIFWEILIDAFLWPYYIGSILFMIFNWNNPGVGMAGGFLFFLLFMHLVVTVVAYNE